MARQHYRIDKMVGLILKQGDEVGFPDNPEPPTGRSEYIDFKIEVKFPEPANSDETDQIIVYIRENLPDVDNRITEVSLGEDRDRDEAFEGEEGPDGFMTEKMYLAGSATLHTSYKEGDLEKIFEKMVDWTHNLEDVDAEMDYWR